MQAAADRFEAPRGDCPDVIDSLAITLNLSGGTWSPGSKTPPPAKVVAGWEAIFSKADYVWLSASHGSKRRIPWTPALSDWFNATFAKLGPYAPGTGQLYVRVTHPTTSTGSSPT